MTPKELVAVFEAAAWRREQEQQRDIWVAWHTAALTRAKDRLPSLAQLLKPGKTQKLTGAELEERRREFDSFPDRIEVKHGR